MLGGDPFAVRSWHGCKQPCQLRLNAHVLLLAFRQDGFILADVPLALSLL
jgi:hypothetical protein